MPPVIFISAGEASGDVYGGRLATEARRIDSGVSFFGMGGAAMREAGVETLVNADDMAVVGLVEVVANLKTILAAFRTLEKAILERKPDLVILIDYPDFHLRLAARAKKAGIRVLYYISPQVWAWRAGRVNKIARIVDHIAVLFPFEVPYYEKVGLPVTFVGHPLLDIVRTGDRPEARAAFGLENGDRVVGLFPGSRRSEIRNLFPTILDAARLLREKYPDIRFLLPLAPSLSDEEIVPAMRAAGVDAAIVRGRIYDVMAACDAVVTVSGTVTMELALTGTPMVIIYRVSPLTYHVGRRLIRIPHFGICNIVAGEKVVPELLQDEATGERIVEELSRFLDDPAHAAETGRRLAEIREKLGSGGCSARVAGLALRMAGEARR